jgi:penicillin-binding protein 1A
VRHWARMRLVLRILRVIFSSTYLAIVTFVAAPLALAGAVLAGLLFLPLPATIPVPLARAVAQPTTVYDRNGGVIGVFQESDQNIPVTEAQIPAVVKEAVIADEDRNFFHEGGIDLRGTLRALVADLRNEAIVEGGSTITQQYVKLAYVGSQRTIVRKVREAILASQLDRQASKNEILYRYLSLVYFGDGNYGVGAAAQNYFHEPIQDLDASQAATLAGLIPAPSYRAPTVDLPVAEKYRELVLGKMLQQGYLTEAGFEQALGERLATAPVPGQAAPPGATLVYGQETAQSPYPAFVDYVQRWLEANGYTTQQIMAGGLRIQTTMDPALEQEAMAAVGATVSGTTASGPNPLEMALASVQPQTGFVEAIVGGRDYTTVGDANFALSGCDYPKPTDASPKAVCWDGNQVDNAGGSGRQPGSAWKPFVLATAFEQGITPTTMYSAPPSYQIPGCRVYPGQPAGSCTIGNYGGESFAGGHLDLAQAMAASVNTVYAQLAPQVGCANVARTAREMGIDSAYWSPTKFPFCQPYALGELDVSPLDMASAYGVFDNHGRRAAPTPILEIVGPTGKVLLDNISKAPATAQVIPANVADNVTNVLEGVLQPGGTAAGHPLTRPAAGKTGTTNNETNAWFTGYTPTLSTSVWMGYLSQATGLGDIKGIDPVVGGTWPAATWQAYMTRALAGVPATPFSAPAPITPPVVAGALRGALASPPTTVGPGPAGFVESTPEGGPYVMAPEAPPVASPPVEPVQPYYPTTTLPYSGGGTGGFGPVPGPAPGTGSGSGDSTTTTLPSTPPFGDAPTTTVPPTSPSTTAGLGF